MQGETGSPDLAKPVGLHESPSDAEESTPNHIGDEDKNAVETTEIATVSVPETSVSAKDPESENAQTAEETALPDGEDGSSDPAQPVELIESLSATEANGGCIGVETEHTNETTALTEVGADPSQPTVEDNSASKIANAPREEGADAIDASNAFNVPYVFPKPCARKNKSNGRYTFSAPSKKHLEEQCSDGAIHQLEEFRLPGNNGDIIGRVYDNGYIAYTSNNGRPTVMNYHKTFKNNMYCRKPLPGLRIHGECTPHEFAGLDLKWAAVVAGEDRAETNLMNDKASRLKTRNLQEQSIKEEADSVGSELREGYGDENCNGFEVKDTSVFSRLDNPTDSDCDPCSGDSYFPEEQGTPDDDDRSSGNDNYEPEIWEKADNENEDWNKLDDEEVRYADDCINKDNRCMPDASANEAAGKKANTPNKKKRKSRSKYSGELPSTAPDPAVIVEEKDYRQYIEHVLETILSEDELNVAQLLLGCWTQMEIAKILGIAQGDVSYRLKKIKEKKDQVMKELHRDD